MSDENSQESIKRRFDNLSPHFKEMELRRTKTSTPEEYARKVYEDYLNAPEEPKKEIPKERPKKGSIVKKQYGDLIALAVSKSKTKELPKDCVAFPNDLSRNNMFGIKQRKDADKYHVKRELCRYGDNIYLLTGPALDQDDKDVFYYIESLKQNVNEENSVTFCSAQALRELGRTRGGENIKKLVTSVNKLKAAIIHIQSETNDSWLSVNLFDVAGYKDGKFFIKFGPALSNFSDCEMAWINRKKRLLLKGHLSRWLADFVCTHTNKSKSIWTEISLQKIHDNCQSNLKSMKRFKQEVNKSLKEIMTHYYISDFKFNGSNVCISRTEETKNQFYLERA